MNMKQVCGKWNNMYKKFVSKWYNILAIFQNTVQETSAIWTSFHITATHCIDEFMHIELDDQEVANDLDPLIESCASQVVTKPQ